MPIAEPKTIERLPGEAPASAGMGHNRPPITEEAKQLFREAMLERHPTYEQRITDLEGAANRCEVVDERSAGQSADLIRQIRAMGSAVSEAHKEVKAPYWEAGKVVDAEKNALDARLKVAHDAVQAKATQFLREEEARRDAERRRQEAIARQQAEEAEAAERARREAEGAGDIEGMGEVEVAAAPVVVQRKPEPIRSADTGASISGRKVWQSQVEDYTVAAIQVLDDEKVREAIDAAIARRVRAGIHAIEGVKIWQAVVARVN